MGSHVKVTYVALNEDGKPIMTASEFDDLRKGLDDHYGVGRLDAQCLGFTPYYTKYPDEYEGHYSYSYSWIVKDEKVTEIDVIKVYCIDYWPHTIYET
jgi:hypothetical protein